MAKRYPHNRARYWYAYEIDDICTLFSDIGLHPQTVRKWINQDALKTIDRKKPTLIYGNDLIAFLKKQNIKSKCALQFGEMLCMKCKDARPLYQNKITITQKNKVLAVSALCRTCKTKMNKTYSLTDIPSLRKKFYVVDVLELYDCGNPSDKTHIPEHTNTPANESSQGSLF